MEVGIGAETDEYDEGEERDENRENGGRGKTPESSPNKSSATDVKRLGK